MDESRKDGPTEYDLQYGDDIWWKVEGESGIDKLQLELINNV